MKHLFLLNIAAGLIYIRDIGDDVVTGYVPDEKNVKMVLIKIPIDKFPIDGESLEEIKKIIN